jgi:hypothetical protein
MPKTATRRVRAPKAPKALTGPKSLYRGKIRQPFTLQMQPATLAIEEEIQRDTGYVSRGDIYDAALQKFGDQIKAWLKGLREASQSSAA